MLHLTNSSNVCKRAFWLLTVPATALHNTVMPILYCNFSLPHKHLSGMSNYTWSMWSQVLQMCCPLPCFLVLCSCLFLCTPSCRFRWCRVGPAAEQSSRTHSPLSVIITPAVHLRGTIYRRFRTNGPRVITYCVGSLADFCLLYLCCPYTTTKSSSFVLESHFVINVKIDFKICAQLFISPPSNSCGHKEHINSLILSSGLFAEIGFCSQVRLLFWLATVILGHLISL